MPGTLPETVARVEEKVDGLRTTMDRLCLLIEGDGGEVNPGLKVTVDRLVQTEKRRKWVVHAALTGFIGLIAERIWGLLR